MLWLLGVGVASCASPEPVASPVSVMTAEPTALPPTAEPVAEPPAPALSAEPPSSSPTAAPIPTARPPSRSGVAGPTRGTVACGNTRCTAPGQGCFLDLQNNRWVCQDVDPVDPEMALHQGRGLGIRCDDGFDCPDGETCCSLWGYGARLCVQRDDVSSLCAREVCMKDGARCPPGRSCSAEGDEEGECVAPEGPATCAKSRRCPKDKPICALTDSGPVCVAKGTPEYEAVPGDRRYRCTHQSDCHAGDVCQYVFGEVRHEMQTYCGRYRPGFRGSVVCDTTRPPPCGGDPECEELNVCNSPTGERAKHLPWMGVQ